MTETTSPIDQALKKGLGMHVFRSGGGLRVVILQATGKGVLEECGCGYGEGINLSEALRIAGEDYLAGGRDYYDVYGKIETHYLTGDYSRDDALDDWICQGHSLDATFSEGEVVVTGEGYVHDYFPECVWEQCFTQGPFNWTDERGFVWEVRDTSAKIIKSPLFPSGKKRQGSFWKCRKSGRGKTFAEACAAMLAATPEEVEE